jgi:putative peptide zinc metalloprotease protein
MNDTVSERMPRVGDTAPEFRLPTAQGGELGPQDFRGNHRTVLWFSKGLFCPFCRRNMAQLGLRYSEIRALDTEILQITHNTLDEARSYFKRYPMAFPYLCDPERVAHDRYGVALEHAGVRGFLVSGAAVAADFVLRGEPTPLPLPYFKRYALKDSPQAVFILDRDGVVRAVHRLEPNAPLPSAEQLVRELESLPR